MYEEDRAFDVLARRGDQQFQAGARADAQGGRARSRGGRSPPPRAGARPAGGSAGLTALRERETRREVVLGRRGGARAPHTRRTSSRATATSCSRRCARTAARRHAPPLCARIARSCRGGRAERRRAAARARTPPGGPRDRDRRGARGRARAAVRDGDQRTPRRRARGGGEAWARAGVGVERPDEGPQLHARGGAANGSAPRRGEGLAE